MKVSLSSTTKYLQRLAEKQIIQRTNRGLYAVDDPMFRAFVRARSR